MEPKFIISEFILRVRSQITCGAELLTLQDCAPFIEVDQKLTRMFLVKILKLGDRPLTKKHQLRLQLALKIRPTRWL